LSKEIQEKFYLNVANSSNLHSDQSALVVMINNEGPDNNSQNSGDDTSPKNKKKSKGKGAKNASWIAEKNHILKKYSHRLMRKKPRSWQP
jgi:hypothetical protein